MPPTMLLHGQQQLALFNTHAGGYCFQPIKIFEATTGRPVLSLLRPGKRPSGEEVEPMQQALVDLDQCCYSKAL
jgi:Transposase DDE domain group 1